MLPLPAPNAGTIQLVAGVYEMTTWLGRRNVKIIGTPGATLTGLSLPECSGITISGVDFVGPGNTYGLNAEDGQDILIEDCTFDGFSHAMVFGRIRGLQILRPIIQHFTSDGIDLVNVWDFLIDRAVITNPNVDMATHVHPDAIQIRTEPFNPNNYNEIWLPTSDGVISNCVISGVPMQGIALTNHIRDWVAKPANKAHGWPALPAMKQIDDGGMRRVKFIGNHITGGGQALSMRGPSCIDCEMTNNLIETHPLATSQALFIYEGAVNMRACGNVMAACGRLGKHGFSDAPCRTVGGH